MRISVESGGRTVHIQVKGRSAKLLRQAEEAARRLLLTAPELPPARPPFGFGATSDHDLSGRAGLEEDRLPSLGDLEDVTLSHDQHGE